MLDDRSYMQSPEFRMRPSFPPVTIALILLNLGVLLFLEISKVYNAAGYKQIIEQCALSRDGILGGHLWQLITFQFMHAGPLHCLFNMVMLFFLGRAVEESIGSKHTLLLYLCSGFIGGLVECLAEWGLSLA